MKFRSEAGSPPPEEAVWIDLINPATVQEDKLVEQLLGIAVPTREEMQEIEVSSRLYVEHHGARYMTATLMCQSDTAIAEDTRAVTFILGEPPPRAPSVTTIPRPFCDRRATSWRGSCPKRKCRARPC